MKCPICKEHVDPKKEHVEAGGKHWHWECWRKRGGQ